MISTTIFYNSKYQYKYFYIDGEGAPAEAAGDANGEKKEKVEDVENAGGEAS